MPASTGGALVNWISEYWTTSTRLPHGSRKWSPRPGSTSTPASWSACRTRAAVIHHEPEVAVPVRRAGLALRERQELVAHVEEGHARHAAAQLELEDAAVEVDRLVHVADRQRDVVDADQPRHSRSIGFRAWRRSSSTASSGGTASGSRSPA